MNRIPLDIEFYINFCEILIIFNDLKYFYQEDLENTLVNKLLTNISYSLLQRISIDGLLKFYPVYVKEHIHFFIYTSGKKFNLNPRILYDYFNSDIIQKNEWEEHNFGYLVNQINFMRGISSYELDTTQVNMFKNHDKTIDNLSSVKFISLSLKEYLSEIRIQINQLKNENSTFSEIKVLLLEEAKSVSY
ncbi:putative uncharacterized protein [Streptococcus troglodytae]|uniref:Uncharacterized protein n=1 Tax=Streptococcus troglodytae TaxID=1111760 RepID=A0A1L7LM48_9STRE|nr:hypothetical protein [Streptococcus troglodytae]BAQ25198.1 putative uncharacterized protein [Streptococcus troglodytae]